MITSNENAKVTLADLFTLVCFFAPVASGVVEGLKGGTVGAVVGIPLGIILGVLCALGFRISCASVASRVCSTRAMSSAAWQVMSEVLLLIFELMCVLGGSVIAQLVICFVVRQTAL